MWIVKLSINHPVFMTMIEIFLIVMGLIGFAKIGVDLYPKIDPPVIMITTQYKGAGPEEIESLVTKPIEEQVNQIGGINQMTSYSRQGVSQVIVEFKLEIDAKEAQTDVRDRVSRIRNRLPTDVDEPIILRMDFSDRPILQIAVQRTDKNYDAASDAELHYIADQIVKPKIEQVDGVGQIDIFGGLEREISIDLELDKLVLWKVTPAQVADGIRNSNQNIPGGEILEEPTRRSIRVMGEYAKVSDVADTIVKTLSGGHVVRVRDVGTVHDTYKERSSAARVNGEPAVILEIKRQSDANTVAVSDQLNKRVPELVRYLPPGVQVKPVYDGSRIIRASLYDVVETIVIAAVLAVIVVYFFLGSVQSTLITGLALPCTIVASFFALYITHFTLNMMTLLGMSLSVGLILDDAIVVRENIWNKLESGMSPKEAALKGTEQVYIAVLATSATILATFLPVTLIPGIVGKFFGAFALTVCLAVLLSTFDAVTMAPMLSAYMVTAQNHEAKRNFVLQFFENQGEKISKTYRRLLGWSLKHPFRVLASAFGIFCLSIFLLRFIGFSFLPQNENGEIDINIEGPVSNSIVKTNSIAERVEKKLKTYKEVEFFTARVGSDLNEANIASFYVKLVPFSKRSRSTSDMKTEFIHAFEPMRQEEDLVLSVRDSGGGGGGRAVSVFVQGPDNDKLAQISNKVMSDAATEVPEVVNLESSMKPGREEIQFSIDRKRAAEFALKPEDIGNAIKGFFEGEIAGQYREKGEEYDLHVHLRAAERLRSNIFDRIIIPNARDEAVPLTAVAQMHTGYSPTKIIRIDQNRAVQFQGDLAPNIPLAAALKKLGAYITQTLPRGYDLQFSGQAKSLKDLQVGAIGAILLGMTFIYMVMASLYGSFILPYSILLPLPLSIVGAFGALLIAGRFLDIYSMIGLIMLMGLVTKNAILVVDYVEQLRRDGMERDEALLEGGVRRMRPIMMTTIAMVAGMLPVAFGFGELNKVRSGMGIAAIGGLMSSTLLSLLVVPCAYIYLDRFRMFTRRFFIRK